MIDECSYCLHLTGYASTLPVDDDESEADARVRRMHEVIAEVTGRSVQAVPVGRPIGFLWPPDVNTN